MTARTKEFLVEQRGGLYIIKLEGGGDIPAVLKGEWTTPTLARRAIDSLLAKEATAKSKKAK